MRITHRRCRHEVEGLAVVALHQTERAENLALKVEDLAATVERKTTLAAARADDLRAAEHQLDEIRDACEDVEYAKDHAAIPEVLREKLLAADERDHVLAEHSRALGKIDELTEQRDHVLAAAHATGMLARVYALMVGAGSLHVPVDLAWLLSQMNTITWSDSPWTCKCESRDVVLVWHPAARHRACLTCRCGHLWTTPNAVDRGEAVLAEHQLFGGRLSQTPRHWPSRPAYELAAMDRAMPTPTEASRAAASKTADAVPA